jgi:hypothetical protein
MRGHRPAPIAVVALAALSACKKDDDAVSPYQLLEICTPGGSPVDCNVALALKPRTMFPAGRLEGLEIFGAIRSPHA